MEILAKQRDGRMTNREKAICMAFTGVSFFKGEQLRYFYQYVEGLLGRPVYTHEIALLADKIKELSREDFTKLCEVEDDEF